MAQGLVESPDSIEELHGGSTITIRRVALVFEIWQNECACGAGACEPSDCPGTPSKDAVAKVLAWIKDGGEAPDVWPFREEEYWDNCIKRGNIL